MEKPYPYLTSHPRSTQPGRPCAAKHNKNQEKLVC